jgi:outer membrane lipoprotein-sorting protein
MRWFIVLITGALVPSLTTAQDSDQKIYQSMEEKIANAKTHKVTFEVDESYGKYKTSGELILGSHGQLKLTSEVTERKTAFTNSKHRNNIVVSDGKSIMFRTQADARELRANSDKETDEKSWTLLVNGLKRNSLYSAIASVLRVPRSTLIDAPSNFTDLGKEMVEGHNATVVGYTLAQKDQPRFACKIWINPDTMLPLKRTIEAKKDGVLTVRVVETYKKWELNPKLQDSDFVLPK